MGQTSSNGRFVAILLAVTLPVAGLIAWEYRDVLRWAVSDSAPPEARVPVAVQPANSEPPVSESPRPATAPPPDASVANAVRIYKCVERGRVVYGDQPCSDAATTREMAIRDGSSGIGGAVYRRQLAEMTESRSSGGAAASFGSRRDADRTDHAALCASLHDRANALVSLLRTPHTAGQGDVWNAELKRVRDQSFTAGCGSTP